VALSVTVALVDIALDKAELAAMAAPSADCAPALPEMLPIAATLAGSGANIGASPAIDWAHAQSMASDRLRFARGRRTRGQFPRSGFGGELQPELEEALQVFRRLQRPVHLRG